MNNRWFIGLVIFMSVLLTSTVSATEDNYPPPTGVTWGWQDNVFFALNNATLRKTDLPVLERLAITLQQYPDVNLLITGRADNTGGEAHNQELSSKRAQAVRQYLLKQGVSINQLHVQEMGEQRPVASDACPEDRERNRRVDLAFFPQGYLPDIPTPVQGDTSPQTGECETAKEIQRFIQSH